MAGLTSEISQCLRRALKQRAALLPSPDTNAFRLIDGEGDGLPGITVEVFDTVGLISTQDRPLPEAFRHAAQDFPFRTGFWKRLDQTSKEAPQWLWGEPCKQPFLIQEKGLYYEVSMQAGYSQGLFLDQRLNRAQVRARARDGQRVLNTFSYTSAFSVAAASGGAVATSLDLSKNYLEWGKRNFLANGIDPANHYFCRGDASEWMERFARQHRDFNGVILDPPTFSRNRSGVFQAKKHYAQLVQRAAKISEPGGWILACCNDRGLPHARFETLVREGVGLARRRIRQLEHAPMPSDFTGPDYLKSVWIDLAS